MKGKRKHHTCTISLFPDWRIIWAAASGSCPHAHSTRIDGAFEPYARITYLQVVFARYFVIGMRKVTTTLISRLWWQTNTTSQERYRFLKTQSHLGAIGFSMGKDLCRARIQSWINKIQGKLVSEKEVEEGADTCFVPSTSGRHARCSWVLPSCQDYLWLVLTLYFRVKGPKWSNFQHTSNSVWIHTIYRIRRSDLEVNARWLQSDISSMTHRDRKRKKASEHMGLKNGHQYHIKE